MQPSPLALAIMNSQARRKKGKICVMDVFRHRRTGSSQKPPRQFFYESLKAGNLRYQSS
jgi:hypothetical protein